MDNECAGTSHARCTKVKKKVAHRSADVRLVERVSDLVGGGLAARDGLTLCRGQPCEPLTEGGRVESVGKVVIGHGHLCGGG